MRAGLARVKMARDTATDGKPIAIAGKVGRVPKRSCAVSMRCLNAKCRKLPIALSKAHASMSTHRLCIAEDRGRAELGGRGKSIMPWPWLLASLSHLQEVSCRRNGFGIGEGHVPVLNP